MTRRSPWANGALQDSIAELQKLGADKSASILMTCRDLLDEIFARIERIEAADRGRLAVVEARKLLNEGTVQ